MNPLQKLREFGQSVWYDNIERRVLENGELARIIAEDGILGLTSNPTIFKRRSAEAMIMIPRSPSWPRKARPSSRPTKPSPLPTSAAPAIFYARSLIEATASTGMQAWRSLPTWRLTRKAPSRPASVYSQLSTGPTS